MYIEKAVANAEKAKKASVTGQWILLKHVGLALAWAIIEIAENIKPKEISLEGSAATGWTEVDE